MPVYIEKHLCSAMFTADPVRPRGEMDIIAGFEPAVGGSNPSEDTLRQAQCEQYN